MTRINFLRWIVCSVLCLLPTWVGGQEAVTSGNARQIGTLAIPDDIPLAAVPATTTRVGRKVRVDLVAPRGTLEFESAPLPSGEIATSLTARFGGDLTPLEAVVAADRQSIAWNGHGSVLTRDSLDALERLAAELELQMLQPDVSPEVEWAFRIVSFWAEAPIGLVIGQKETLRPRVDAPDEKRRSFIQRESIGDATDVLSLDREDAVDEGRPIQADAGKAKCAKGCNVDSDDGIVYLEGSGKDAACKTKSYKTKHDACDTSTGKGHCYASYTVSGGCNRKTGCPGRLGPGCGVTGYGVYSKDCLEHDYCVGHDSACALCPGDNKCGDEWWDAADDTFGRINCNGCK
jgi:hypothetical protein